MTFDAVVEPMAWGASVYTVIRVPADVTAALGKTKRVEGEINDHPVNLALTKAPVIDGVFLWAGKSLLSEISISPGEPLVVRLRPVSDEVVDVPRDVALALRSSGKTNLWEALTPGKKRGLLYPINSAKRPQTRQDRIAKMLSELS